MILATIAFYVFAAITVGAAVMVIAARNPVHSVLFLILAFFASAGLFVLVGAEFLAMLLIVVYVGAVAVLFLFVVMMLDINLAAMREGFLQYLPTGAVIGLVLLVEIALAVSGARLERVAPPPTPAPSGLSNTEALGAVLYTDYVYLFQGAGIILLVAMIGAIVLTHRRRAGVRYQSIPEQLARTRAQGVELRKVRPGEGASS